MIYRFSAIIHLMEKKSERLSVSISLNARNIDLNKQNNREGVSGIWCLNKSRHFCHLEDRQSGVGVKHSIFFSSADIQQKEFDSFFPPHFQAYTHTHTHTCTHARANTHTHTHKHTQIHIIPR